ncbi:PREDICTED: acyl-CoA dehydrogenase family member 10-like isoform X2 [Priapulus caudatus]|uniref:Acyl-CoA dehydrogenase family member 11 n=1 Tax=Priapulus caudatus TaxID=37621 RepID=A0ABM1DVR9_PRICU|nr:PREDICTED: acyl-CoA dehydrogenase family member 10-like isoform X2 [Priapulus caudatus]
MLSALRHRVLMRPAPHCRPRFGLLSDTTQLINHRPAVAAMVNVRHRSSTSPHQCRAVIFDLGGVVFPQPQRFFNEFETAQGLPIGFMESVISERGRAGSFRCLERGEIDLPKFIPLFDKECSEKVGRSVDLGRVMQILTNTKSKHTPYPQIIDAIQCIRAEGLKTALLTNNWFIRGKESFCPVDMSLFDVVENPAQALRELHAELGFPLAGFVPGTTAVGENYQLPVDRLLTYMRDVAGIEVDGATVNLRQFRHGQSNPTYFFGCGGRNYVLRKKPPGKLLPSAHAVEREFRVMRALECHGVPVPKCLFLCEDSSVIGTPFYMMEHVPGRIFKDPLLPNMTPVERSAIYTAMCDVLVKIHLVNIERAGLQDYGKPGSYWERQLSTWGRQHEASKLQNVPEMDALMAWLREHLPAITAKERRSIVHGDFRLDNLIFHPTKPEVVAVLDWELSTLGDPLADLVNDCVVYHTKPNMPHIRGFGDVDLKLFGIPSEEEFLKLYCRRAGLMRINNWNYYVAFLFFRYCGIAQGIYSRFLKGQAAGANAEMLGAYARQLAKIGLEYTRQGVPKAPKSTKVGTRSYSSLASSPIPRVSQHRHYTMETGSAQSADGNGLLPITVAALSPRAQDYHRRVKIFIRDNVANWENEYMQYQTQPDTRWTVHPRLRQIQARAREAGLANLFVTRESDPQQIYGAGLTNVEYAHICELMGMYLLAPEVFNCQAPDTGNMETLMKYATEEQKQQWLVPMVEGRIRSCFGMTEPQVASSDATNIQSSITRDGNEYIINGHKWWTSGAMHPDCKLCVFMGKTDPSADKHKQHTMILIPMDAPGVKVIRPLTVFGFEDSPEGHAEVLFKNVRVPASNILLGEGRGFEIAQGRLGPGRIHHCMRLIGMSERALQLMVQRVLTRETFGQKIAEHGTIQADISQSRIEIEQGRLLVLKVALMMDTVGNKKAASEIAMIKVVAPLMAQHVLDRSIQAFGAAGVCGDWPLAHMWAAARALRLADGPDEVHRRSVARLELRKSKL